MKYLAAIFDFDYTLGDSTDGIITCVNDALARMNVPASPADEIRKTIGLTLPEMFMRLTGVQDAGQGTQFFRLFMEKADEVMTGSTELFPDTVPLLSWLKQNGVKTGIVTTKFHYRITAVLEKFGVQELVDVIVGYEDVQNPKPHPEALLLAVKTLGVPKDKVIYVGDSLVDAKITQNAQIDFIAVTSGTTKAEQFAGYPHRAIAGSLQEIHDRGLLL
jgi:phosphoglycolate phosphatase